MSLTSLPTELLELISAYLDLPAFLSLRLASRHYRTRTLLIFTQRFFTTQHLAWTKTSLQRLVDISNHPKLGNALQHLAIDATPYHALSLWKMRRRSSDAGHFTPPTDDEDGSKLTQSLSGQYETISQEAQKIARWLSESRFDIACLKTTFARIHSLKSITFSFTGMEMRYSKFARRYCETSQCELSRPFVSTLHALAATQTTVQRIGIAKGMGYGAISMGRLEALAPSLRAFDHVFEKLESLHLELRDWRSPDAGFELESTRAPFVVRFLAKCRNVTVLDLSSYSKLEEDLFGELVGVGRFEKLECVTLQLFRVKRVRDLVAFLKPSEKCLRQLRLRHILLDDPESAWKDVFVHLADVDAFAALRAVHVERLFTQRSSGVKRVLFYDETSSASALRVEGQSWRDDLKERGCIYAESEAGRMWEGGAISYPFMRSDSI